MTIEELIKEFSNEQGFQFGIDIVMKSLRPGALYGLSASGGTFEIVSWDESNELPPPSSQEIRDEYIRHQTIREFIDMLEANKKKKTKIKKSEIISQKQTYNKFECAVFDALQNAYKVTANSLYGQIGARTSPIYLKDIAACTTSTGREMIMLAKNFVESNYDADVIYGDTDSIFCKFKIKNEYGLEITGKDALPYAIKIGQEVERKIKSFLPYPQKLNYENQSLSRDHT